jgi:hypothetical protein
MKSLIEPFETNELREKRKICWKIDQYYSFGYAHERITEYTTCWKKYTDNNWIVTSPYWILWLSPISNYESGSDCVKQIFCSFVEVYKMIDL